MMDGHSLGAMGSQHVKDALTPAAPSLKPDDENISLAGLAFEKALSALNDPAVELTALSTSGRGLIDVAMAAACKSGGSAQLQLNDKNNTQKADSGDELTFTFTNCNDGMMTMNGQIAVNNFVLNGTPVANTPQAWSFSGNFVFEDFETVMSGKTTIANGTIGGTWGIDATGKQTALVNLKNFEYTKNSETTTFTNLSMTVETSKTAQETTNSMSMAGEVSHPKLGTMVVQTLEGKELVSTSLQPHPISGSITVTRAAEGSMKGFFVKVESTEGSEAVFITVTADNQQLSTKSTTWSQIHRSMQTMSGGSMAGGTTTSGATAGGHTTHGS
jgi:hypothetical protein